MPDPRTQDTRLCFLGDSLTLGVGDPGGLGWAGRVAERRRHEGWTLTTYNLGLRGDTGRDLVRRLPEATVRLQGGDQYGLVVSFGVNDTATDHGHQRSTSAESVAALDELIQAAEINGWALLVIGPPPVGDPDWNLRLRRLSGLLSDTCDVRGVRFVDCLDLLHRDPTWEAALRAGDGAHPVAGGYTRWAGLLDPAFTAWLSARWP